MLPKGPSSETRKTAMTHYWGEAISEDGSSISATLSCPSVYQLTADVAVSIIQDTKNNNKESGFKTPAMLMGAEFILGRPGCQLSTNSRTTFQRHLKAPKGRGGNYEIPKQT